MANILICDDEKDIVNALKIYLSDPSYVLFEAYDGLKALEIVQSQQIDLILLDIMGLNIGADDYITKPFNPLEVTARVNSQLRRYLRLGSNVKEKETYVIGGIVMDDRKKEVLVDDKTVNLTPKEYEILKLMMSHPDEVFSPKQIYTAVWKEEPYGAENTVAVHIRHLREKIEIDPAEPRYIKVIFGQGYKIGKGRRK